MADSPDQKNVDREPCPSTNPETGHACVMAQGHAGPHKVGDLYHPTERWVTQCVEGCTYHGNSNPENNKFWVKDRPHFLECINCGHIPPVCPEGEHQLMPRTSKTARKVFYVCQICGTRLDKPEAGFSPKPEKRDPPPETQAAPKPTKIPLDEAWLNQAVAEEEGHDVTIGPTTKRYVTFTLEEYQHLFAILGACAADEDIGELVPREILGKIVKACAEADPENPAHMSLTQRLDRIYTLCLDLKSNYQAKVARLELERKEIMANQQALTCVFCGHLYPPGTPQSNHDLLRQHVLECPEHPAKVFRDLLVEAVPFLQTVPFDDHENGTTRIMDLLMRIDDATRSTERSTENEPHEEPNASVSSDNT